VHAQLGDTAAARSAAVELRGLEGAPHSAAFGADLALGVEAEVERLAGEVGRALTRLEAMEMRPSNIVVSFSPFYSHARERFVRAELLHAAGRDEEAAEWYALVAESPPFGYVFLGPSLRGRAMLHEQQGEADAAARLYRRLIALWSAADPSLLPLIDHARERLGDHTAGGTWQR
jgi:tetratricopeptide (TPR) repeat protein